MSQPVVADLHTHSTASDGVDAPARVVERAAALGLEAIALTDHDMVAGVQEACARGRELGLTVIAGAEMTCYFDGREVHMLAFRIDATNEPLRAHCTTFHHARIARAHEIARRLEALGAPIDIEKCMASADAGAVGRVHVAKALLEAGHVATMEEAFDRFLGDGKPANVTKPNVSPKEVIDMIRAAGGVAVIAHPGLGNQFDLIPRLVPMGLAGVEVIHSAHTSEDTDKSMELAMRFGLLRSGGSDCHGELPSREPIMGKVGLDAGRWQTFQRDLEKL